MFAQIIEGTVADADLLKRQMQRWRDEVKPGAVGYLGSTGGITTDGTFVIVVRFSDEGAAKENADRPEQDAWWRETEKAFTGEVTSVGSADVDVFMEGDDGAGFVQMMRAKVADRARFEAADRGSGPMFVEHRPDVMGHVSIWLPGNVVHVVDWFTSEAEARAGEKKEMPQQLQDAFRQWMGQLSDVRWYDISEPEIDSA